MGIKLGVFSENNKTITYLCSHCVGGFCVVYLFCGVVLSVQSIFALLRKRELVASCCHVAVSVLCLFLSMRGSRLVDSRSGPLENHKFYRYF